ncbi:MAG TPA: cation:proton antiporter [Candidatus Tectomicrobia bacterium]|nr:cation:proton antiporter [Candidatus Tectomicrobia bacterium]
MDMFGAATFGATLALLGIVIMVSALLSGLIERSGMPQVAVFLAIGAALGPAGLGALNLTLDSSALRIVATLSLTLVLFTDAVTLDLSEVRRHTVLALRVLGPGTLLSAALVAMAACWVLDLSWPAAIILGAALASTDPVLLRSLLGRRDIPRAARQALRLESGLNDAVLLPVLIVAMAFLGQEASLTGVDWARLGLDLFVLGPGAGVAVGLLSVATLDLIRRRIGVRRDYESVYSIGVAFTAYAAAEAVHGSGFLAAFTAGITIVALDVELCDCFIDYGAATAEMALLFTFVLFGASLIWSGFTVISGPTVAFAIIVLLVRPPVFLLSLAGSRVERMDRLLIAWFGPRGLSSLLLVLLPVFAGLPGSDQLFAICCLVVLLSVAVHGGSPVFLGRRTRRRVAAEGIDASSAAAAQPASAPIVAAEQPGDGYPAHSSRLGASPSTTSTAPFATAMPARQADTRVGEPVSVHADPQSISIAQLRHLWDIGAPVVILDVRTDRAYDPSPTQVRGAIRLPPDHVGERARELELPRDAWLVAYCS